MELQNNTELIEAYLHQKMSLEERSDFEQNLATNPQLQEELKAQKIIHDGFKGIQLAALEEKAQQWEDKLKAKDVVPGASSTSFAEANKWKIGASAVGFSLLLAVLYFFQPQDCINEQYVASHFKNDMAASIRSNMRGQRGPTGKELFDQALKFDDEKNYDAAITTFQKVPHGHPNYTQAQILIADILFQQKKDYDATLEVLQQIANGKDSRYSFEAEWGILMVYITKEERSVAFEQQLASILSSSDHPYFQQTKALKAQLEDMCWEK